MRNAGISAERPPRRPAIPLGTSTARGGGSRPKKSGSKTASRSRGKNNSQSTSSTTADHEEIRRWAEERGGRPATVRSTVGEGHEAGIIRIDFPGCSGGDSLEEITWDEFLEKFEESKLALVYQETMAYGTKSNFNKLVARD